MRKEGGRIVRYFFIRVALVAGCLGFCAPGNLLAQQNLPGTVQPGQIQRRLQPAPTPKSTLQEISPVVPKERLPPSQAAKINFTLRRLQVVGTTVYREADFLPFYKAYLGKRISIADLYQIADAITVKYRNAGYILSRAYVPAQEIKDGSARIEVVEGYVDQVLFKGRPPGRDSLFQYYADQITQSRPLKASVLERYLLLAGDLAGAHVRSVFEPSATHVGAATLIVTFTEKRLELHSGLDNRGTDSLGPLEISAGGAVNDPFGWYGRTALDVVTTPQNTGELQYYSLTQEETLNGEGTKAVMSLSDVHTHPDDVLAPLDVKGRDTAVALSLTHPFIRSRSKNLGATISFRSEDSTTDELGVRAADDSVRSLGISGSYDFADAFRGISQFIVGLRQGLPIFGATPNDNPLASRTGAETTFTKLTFSASRRQELPAGFLALVQASGQYACEPLTASEQFAYGGEPFGRAYDPSEVTGDSGIDGSLEVDYAPGIPEPHLQSSVFFAYVDAGRVYSRIHPQASGYESGTSAGLGLRLTPLPWLYGSVEADKPLTRDVAANGNKEWRFFFRLDARY